MSLDDDSPIEICLDELVTGLRGVRPRELRLLLAEAESHLRDDAAREIASGATPQAAELTAVARFGPARTVAAAERDRLATPWGTVSRQLGASAVFLGAVGALAVGASGVLALLVRLVAGERVLAAPTSGRLLSASDCRRWLALSPHAASCRVAATHDWANEIVFYRIAVGLLGLAALGLIALVRKRSGGVAGWTVAPVVASSVAVAVFGIAGAWTLGLGIDSIAVSNGDGSGQWLAAAPAAIAAAAVFGLRLLQTLRHDERPLAAPTA